MAWLTADAVAALPVGTAIAIEPVGRHTARTIGRVTGHLDGAVELLSPAHGEILVELTHINRARVIPALYEPGDAVLLRHVSADRWRGGVVRTEGERVLIEQIDGAFVWRDEADIEPAEVRAATRPEPAGSPL